MTKMETQQAIQYLESLIGQTLRVRTTDTRIFVGLLKCTDAARNIILANTFEYRYPSSTAVEKVASGANTQETHNDKPENIKVDMASRLIGLVVIPGQHITKIELEETAEQAKLRDTLTKS